MQRHYHNITKSQLANAYGYSRAKSIINRVEMRIEENHIDKKMLQRLGDWRGHTNLLPDQVEILVEILGKPQHPEKIYTEKN